jgi:hypothetical protein
MLQTLTRIPSNMETSVRHPLGTVPKQLVAFLCWQRLIALFNGYAFAFQCGDNKR